MTACPHCGAPGPPVPGSICDLENLLAASDPMDVLVDGLEIDGQVKCPARRRNLLREVLAARGVDDAELHGKRGRMGP